MIVYVLHRFKPQTQLGADMLAHALRARVVMPDFFEPSAPWDAARHPPKTDADRAALQAFFGGPARPQDAVPKLARVGAALRADGARRVGAYGLCWGECIHPYTSFRVRNPGRVGMGCFYVCARPHRSVNGSDADNVFLTADGSVPDP